MKDTASLVLGLRMVGQFSRELAAKIRTIHCRAVS